MNFFLMIFVQFFTGTLGLLRGTASKIVVNNGAPRTGTGEEAEKKINRASGTVISSDFLVTDGNYRL